MLICCWSTMTSPLSRCDIPVFNKTSAMDDIQHLEGSIARKPHESSRSKPLIHSMSIRCCSAMLFSLLTFRWSAVNMLVLSRSWMPDWRLSEMCFSSARPASFVNPFSGSPSAPAGGITKYSSSSRSTMMACFVNKGFREPVKSLGFGLLGSTRCAWAWKGPGESTVP